MRFESAEDIEDFLDHSPLGEIDGAKQEELAEALADYAKRCPPRLSQDFDRVQDVAQYKAVMTRQNPYLEEWIAFREVQNEGGDDALGVFGPHMAEIEKGLKVHDKDSASSLRDMLDMSNEFMVRDSLIKKYGFSVPDQEAIDLCVAQGPLIEIGAGRGYWKKLIEEAGGDVLAVDNFSDSGNGGAANVDGHPMWSDVQQGDHRLAAHYPDRTLLMIWPPLDNDMAAEALSYHYDTGGQRLILVADKPSCAEPRFYSLLRQNYREVHTHYIPRWTMMKDTLEIYERRAVPRARHRKAPTEQ